MTAKEKAKELVDKFAPFIHDYHDKAELEYIKICAIIVVDEIINAIDWHEFEYPANESTYWSLVKTEIILL